MPKMKLKTHRGAAKRFKRMKSGKFKVQRAGNRHLNTKKSPSRKASLGSAKFADKSDVGRIKAMFPNG
ncbi:MAG: 50S ribosomal protein L35 [Candidatus Omnitrophica bacterium]|nr:50S ribosomal protein L35 [Candidatus Omnitrophota bacterium]